MSNKKKIKVKKVKEEEKVDSLTLMVRESLGTMGRSVDRGQEKLLMNIIRSFLVGGLATIIDVILYTILYKAVKIDPVIANAISFIVVLIFSYFMSCKYVFDNNKKKQVKEFLILSIVGLIITELLIFGLVTKLKWYAFLVKLLAIVVVIVVKILLRRFVFNRKNIRK